MNITFNPQEIVVSALAPVLGVDIQNQVDRTIIQGMDYESGEWTQSGNALNVTLRFQRHHDDPPVFVLVYASVGQITANTTFGQLFINYVKLLGYALQTSYNQSKFGQKMLWTTGSSTSSVSQNTTNITSNEGLADCATNEFYYFGSSSGSNYIRNGRKYKWIAIWK